MREKRKVCIHCETWESGGIESFLYDVLPHIDLDKVEVDLVAACLRESVFTAGLQQRGVRFYQLSGSSRRLATNHRRFKQLLWERKYDVLHLNIFHSLSLHYAQLAKQAGVPVRIAHSHGAGLRNSRTKALKLAIHTICKYIFDGAVTDHWACSMQAASFLFPGTEYISRMSSSLRSW